MSKKSKARPKTMSFDVSEAEQQRIRSRAEDEGVPVAIYLRAAALGRPTRGTPRAVVALLNEVRDVLIEGYDSIFPVGRPAAMMACIRKIERLGDRVVS